MQRYLLRISLAILLVTAIKLPTTAVLKVCVADLTLVGAASVSSGKLNLPGGSPRTNHAAALGTAVTELAGTINGSSAISMEVWFSQVQVVSWSKLFMAGSSTAANMDITPTVGNSGIPKIQINDSSHNENNVQWNTASLSNATDYYVAGIWDTFSDMLTIYAGQVGGSLTSFSSSIELMGSVELMGSGLINKH